MRHLLTLFDVTTHQIEEIFAWTRQLKKQYLNGVRQPKFAGKVMALLFEKPSLRTRVSFEAAFAQLHGSAMFLGPEVGWGERESPEDFAKVLTEYVDVVVCRAKDHGKLEQLAEHASCPVVNGLTDLYHPCQALADLLTVAELRGELEGAKIAFVGDSNNVARSLAIACGRLNVEFAIASPPQYQFDHGFLKRLEAEFPRLSLTINTDPRRAVRGADVVYTDVWASMGQESEQVERRAAFAEFQVNAQVMAAAPGHARFLHCMPAHRGEEVTDDVIDGPQSAVMLQAGNRMHLQKGLLAWLLDGRESQPQ
jgi:ornithine carbamoyltransferase